MAYTLGDAALALLTEIMEHELGLDTHAEYATRIAMAETMPPEPLGYRREEPVYEHEVDDTVAACDRPGVTLRHYTVDLDGIMIAAHEYKETCMATIPHN